MYFRVLLDNATKAIKMYRFTRRWHWSLLLSIFARRLLGKVSIQPDTHERISKSSWLATLNTQLLSVARRFFKRYCSGRIKLAFYQGFSRRPCYANVSHFLLQFRFPFFMHWLVKLVELHYQRMYYTRVVRDRFIQNSLTLDWDTWLSRLHCKWNA